jgi:DNA replication protein DnaC
MKIEKRLKSKLKESKFLKEAQDEAQDEVLSEIDPQKDNITDIAQAVQDDVEDSSNDKVEISDADSVAMATEIKSTAKEVNAGSVAIVITDEDYEGTKIITKLSSILDEAYAAAKEFNENNDKNGANVLIEGLPGSGKTAIVEA